MRFLADENIDRIIVERLREAHHEVFYVIEMKPGISDDEVLQKANQESALLITADKDFGELIFRLKKVTCGVILLRCAGLEPEHKAGLVALAVTTYGAALPGNFSVITAISVRIRKQSY